MTRRLSRQFINGERERVRRNNPYAGAGKPELTSPFSAARPALPANPAPPAHAGPQAYLRSASSPGQPQRIVSRAVHSYGKAPEELPELETGLEVIVRVIEMDKRGNPLCSYDAGYPLICLHDYGSNVITLGRRVRCKVTNSTFNPIFADFIGFYDGKKPL